MIALYASLGGVLLFGGLALAFGFSRSRLAKQLGEVTRERDDLLRRLHDMAQMVLLMDEPDPTLPELARLSEDAIRGADAPGGGLSPVEQRAADRILGSRPVGGA